MTKFNIKRWSLMGSAAVLAMAGAFTVANAYETKYGDVSIVFDTTVSMGASMRTAERNTQFLPEGNGGPVDPRDNVALGAVFPATPFGVLDNTTGFLPLQEHGLAPAGAYLGAIKITGNPDNYDGSVNADDARLNFNNGDLIGANIKANHDLQLSWENYKVFVRAVGFYDAVLDDKHAGERSELTDKALGAVGRNYQLLDAFVSADYTVAEMPVNLRVGKQVINWGESTFILGGNNVFNPIDVGAFRRPGSEIKEALIPVTAVSASVTLPFDVSVSGYYALDWEPFRLDAGGTPFSTADVINYGSGQGGNIFARSQLSGSPYSGTRRNCNLDNIAGLGAAGNQTTLAVSNGLLRNPLVSDANHLDCTDSLFVDYTTPYTIGQNEGVKTGLIGIPGITRISQGLLSRNDDRLGDNTGDYGVSARWLSEDLGGTEFGFYYQNYGSRLPFVSEDINSNGELSIGVQSNSTQLSALTNRGLLPAGCGFGATTTTATAAGDAAQTAAATLAFITGGASTTRVISDPDDILNATTKAAALAAAPGTTLTFGATDTVQDAFKMNCMLAYFQMTGTALIANTHVLVNGAETIALASDLGLRLDYPQDIESWGASFNTTVGSWGVQGDFTYRPRAPFQVDTDSLTIAAAMDSCAFGIGVGPVEALFRPLATKTGSGRTPGCGFQSSTSGDGVIYNEMFTAQVGTTSQFTASEWFIEALGADIGTLVTEAGMVYVPSVEDTWLDNNTDKTITQYGNIGCQGSDLGLGGILSLDHKSSRQCRPTDTSAGLVALFILQYNNAFGSGFVVTPTLAYSWDFEGTTPAPYGNYMEDRQSVNLGVTGQLNNNFKVGANYTNFFGGHVTNKSTDTDFASLSASYSF